MLLFTANLRSGSGTTYVLSALPGIYALSGGSASLSVGRKVTANAGTYALTGGTASLKVGRKITASAGSYSFSGGAASLKVARSLTASAGSYSVSGASATLTKTAGATAYSLTANNGSYAISGQAAALSVGRALVGSAGTYSVSGGSAALTVSSGPKAYALSASTGAYLLTGGDATLSWSGEKSGGGGYDEPKKKRYVVEVNGKLLAFQDAQAASDALSHRKTQATLQEAEKPVAKPLFSVSLDDVRVLARERESLDVFSAQLAQMQYDAMLRQYEQWQEEQDLEDLLALL